MSGKVVAVCLSEKKGTEKKVLDSARFVENFGIEGDGHGGTIRQVSLLMKESVDEFNQEHGPQAEPGDFAENVLTSGIDILQSEVGDIFTIGPVRLEVTQIGKELNPLHYSFHGYRLLPTVGVFCKVNRGGVVKPGDNVALEK
jgi:MOSC domain-containing protein YiiM